MDKCRSWILSNSGESRELAIDTLVFRDDGNSSYREDPSLSGIMYCKHCRSWHAKLKLETGLEFCAFCSTTHHSRACGAGLGQKCSDPTIDPIHRFMTEECLKNQEFDLSFCRECNCFHSKLGWKVCLEKNRPGARWSQRRKTVWELRWRACRSSEKENALRRERSLFNMEELVRIVPYEYPYSNAKFVHHCNTN
jgi:hypothetical protein